MQFYFETVSQNMCSPSLVPGSRAERCFKCFISFKVLCLGVLCRALQRESLADFSKMVPDFKKVVPGLVTKHTQFVNRKLKDFLKKMAQNEGSNEGESIWFLINSLFTRCADLIKLYISFQHRCTWPILDLFYIFLCVDFLCVFILKSLVLL